VSAESRATYWKAAVNHDPPSPAHGGGVRRVIRGTSSHTARAPSMNGRADAHSSWLLAFAESGVVGGGLFLAFFVSVWRTAWRKRRERPAHLYALLGYGVAMSFFIPHLSSIPLPALRFDPGVGFRGGARRAA